MKEGLEMHICMRVPGRKAEELWSFVPILSVLCCIVKVKLEVSNVQC